EAPRVDCVDVAVVVHDPVPTLATLDIIPLAVLEAIGVEVEPNGDHWAILPLLVSPTFAHARSVPPSPPDTTAVTPTSGRRIRGADRGALRRRAVDGEGLTRRGRWVPAADGGVVDQSSRSRRHGTPARARDAQGRCDGTLHAPAEQDDCGFRDLNTRRAHVITAFAST